jgi:hypothetical protein
LAGKWEVILGRCTRRKTGLAYVRRKTGLAYARKFSGAMIAAHSTLSSLLLEVMLQVAS